MPSLKRPAAPRARLIAVLLALAVAGCIETTSESSAPAAQQSRVSPEQACANQGGDEAPLCEVPPVSCTGETPIEGGRSYPVMLTSASVETIAFQVLEPIGGIDCRKGHPLVLHGHGFGGSRNTDGFENYREAGFVVISIDQRGFGESSGTVRVMDPEFEGRDLVQILDWAEENLEYLRYRQEPSLPQELNPNLVAGAIGGSYGGGFQLLLHGQDPRQRLDALVPDITWHDLRYSLNPGNVIKTGWDLVLVTGGEAGSTGNGNGGLDPIIREILGQGATLNRFPEAGLDFFYYHSPAYRCTGEPVSVSETPDLLNYQINPPAFDIEPTPYPKVDVLLTQGMKDTLFNFNEAWRNFECLREQGGDVRLLTHQTGHILPVEAPDELQPAEYADPTAGLLEVPGFQGAAGAFACGDIPISDATLNWLEHHLQGKPLAGYFDGTDSNVCLSLADGQSTMVPMDEFPAPDSRGGVLQGPKVVERPVVTELPVASGYEAVATATQPPTALILGKAGVNGTTLGGIPTARLTVSDLAGRSTCEVELDPYAAGCDPIVFVGLGKRGGGESRWQLIDDQIKPVRGLKDQEVIELVGIAETLAPGDELALLVYGFHPQYPASWSRDALVPFVNVEGSVQLPVLAGVLEPPM
ncbi:CocE/NonD family hydrolase [Marinobacter pelagius]|uniref:CocE/NonD family hydrolase n=1 Tax=Marinobacter sp. C7 TaxID=2951363 RepID=UPI001EEFE764|nr:CocE/NonD family hydrolase [Marinobacter sp. C7]MCG7198803.1 CocE/NonD family hydrolase [Marinobacter sp. C7]